jgi:hypothetical protein
MHIFFPRISQGFAQETLIGTLCKGLPFIPKSERKSFPSQGKKIQGKKGEIGSNIKGQPNQAKE